MIDPKLRSILEDIVNNRHDDLDFVGGLDSETDIATTTKDSLDRLEEYLKNNPK